MSSKYSFEIKLEAVQYYINGSESIRATANKFNVAKTELHRWVKKYEIHGENGLKVNYTNYTEEFKMDVLNYMEKTGASSEEATAVFNVSYSDLVRKWKHLFETQGKDALQPKSKERPPIMEKQPKKEHLAEGSEEALRAENERLRMENAYLKKLSALIQEKKKSQTKKRPR